MVTSSVLVLFVLPLFVLLSHPTPATTHGVLCDPPPRGTLGGSPYISNPKDRYPDAPRDNVAHFPAGDKNPAPGSAARSQARYAKRWGLFQPMRPGFRWRAGVCGDLKNRRRRLPQHHLRGGKFYYDGHITRTYQAGSVVEFKSCIVAHHNGFVQYHICDVSKCGGEISEDCFLKKGACHKLRREPTRECDSGKSRFCAPIDRRYPSRWYLPCASRQVRRRGGSKFNEYGGKYMRYRLPRGFKCDHCVLHWFWSAANTCNPPGVKSYFKGPDRPKQWGQCPGQGGARGGVARRQQPCGPNRFPEEYYMCADVRIVGKGGRITRRNEGPLFSEVQLVVRGRDGKPRTMRTMKNGSSHKITVPRWQKLGFKVIARRPIRDGVSFFTQLFQRRGRKDKVRFMRKDSIRPFFLAGDFEGRPNYWSQARQFSGRTFFLIARANGEEIKVKISLYRS